MRASFTLGEPMTNFLNYSLFKNFMKSILNSTFIYQASFHKVKSIYRIFYNDILYLVTRFKNQDNKVGIK